MWVSVERGGDVIPKITGVVTPAAERRDIVFPAACPVCRAELVREEGEVDWRCVNASCPARLRGELLNFGRRSVMNIEGLGKSIVAQLLGQEPESDEATEDDEALEQAEVVRPVLVKSLADLYRLSKDDLLTLDLVGDKKAEALLEQIERSKTAPLARVLLAWDSACGGAHGGDSGE